MKLPLFGLMFSLALVVGLGLRVEAPVAAPAPTDFAGIAAIIGGLVVLVGALATGTVQIIRVMKGVGEGVARVEHQTNSIATQHDKDMKDLRVQLETLQARFEALMKTNAELQTNLALAVQKLEAQTLAAASAENKALGIEQERARQAVAAAASAIPSPATIAPAVSADGHAVTGEVSGTVTGTVTGTAPKDPKESSS